MSPAFWIVIGLFVVLDIVVIAVVLRRVRVLWQGLPSGADRNRILQSAHAMVGDYLRVNYSGDPAHLPTALSGLLPALRDLLRSHGVEPRPEMVRALVEVSAAKHRIATAGQLREALATVH